MGDAVAISYYDAPLKLIFGSFFFHHMLVFKKISDAVPYRLLFSLFFVRRKPVKTIIKTAMSAFFLSVTTVIASAVPVGKPVPNNGLPASDFNWLTFGVIVAVCGAILLRRHYARKRCLLNVSTTPPSI